MYAAGVIGMIFVLLPTEYEQKFALIFSLVPFAVIFSSGKDQTSIFMFLRLALVAYAFRTIKFSFNRIFILCTGMMIIWCVGISSIKQTDYIVRILNIILWIAVGIIMQMTLDAETLSPVGESLYNSTVISGLIGLNLNLIPNLQKELGIIRTMDGAGKSLVRFMGLWNDPNGYTVFICMALWILFFEYQKGRMKLITYMIKALIVTFLGVCTMSKSCIILLVIYWIYIIVSRSKINVLAKIFICIVMVSCTFYFIFMNPEWLKTMLYRFTGDKGILSLETATTHRSSIWRMYINQLNETHSWLFGNGLNCIRPKNRAAHNTILQCIYNIGIIGLLLFCFVFYGMYRQNKMGTERILNKKTNMIALLTLLSTMFFLDALFLELFYYMIPLCFLYMKTQSRMQRR